MVVFAEPGLCFIPGRRVSSRARKSVNISIVVLCSIFAASTILVAQRAHAAVKESIVVDANTGKVIESHNADAQTYPASLAKLMTLYLTFQNIKTGKVSLDTKLTVSSHAASQPPTRLGLHPGESISVQQAILAIVTKSANDAAVVLAESIGGSESNFAVMMNKAARQLRMSDTNFCNASGLPDSHQVTTARDMAKLAMILIHQFPDYYHFFSVRSFVFDGQTVEGHDHLLGEYAGADGMKTGYTRASGFNLVTSARREGHRLVGVVMGGKTHKARDRHMMGLLDVAFAEEKAHPGMIELAHSAELFAPPPRAEDVMKAKALPADGVLSTKVVEQAKKQQTPRNWRLVVGGAFHTRSAARRALRAAKRTLPDRLAHATAVVLGVVRGGRVRSYRAHFAELSGAKAHHICARLRRKKFACYVVQPPNWGIETASAN